MTAVAHPPVKTETRWLLAFLLAPLLLAMVVGLVLLWPSGDRVRLRASGPRVDARVRTVSEAACADTAPEAGIRCARVVLRLVGGARGELAEQSAGEARVRPGDHVVVTRVGSTYELVGSERRKPLGVLSAIAALAVVLVARWRGARLLLALGVAALVLTLFAVPSVLDGHAPMAVALVSAGAVATVLLTLGHGVNARSATALVGVLLAIGAASAVGRLVVAIAHLAGAGVADSRASVLQVSGGAIPTSGLLLGALVLGTVGGLVDVATRQVDATWDLRDAGVDAGLLGIMRAGVRLGGRHLSDVVTTVVLAYAGAMLPLLVLLSAGDQRVVDALGGDALGVEVGRAMAGVLALTLTVPITAAMAALVVVRERADERPAGDPRQFRSRRERKLFEG